MILNETQKKTRKEFSQNYIYLDFLKTIFTDEYVYKKRKAKMPKAVIR